MRTIGLTGSIACGKSNVSDTLRQLGAVIIDGDVLSRELTQPGGQALPAIREAFGGGVFHADGTLDFVMGGTPIEGLTWTEGVSDSGAEAFVIDYFGTGMMLYAVWTDVGFEMDFMGAGMMYFEPGM